MAQTVGERPARLDDPEVFGPAHALATFAWATENISSHGARSASPTG
jgi:hypothetical protein